MLETVPCKDSVVVPLRVAVTVGKSPKKSDDVSMVTVSLPDEPTTTTAGVDAIPLAMTVRL